MPTTIPIPLKTGAIFFLGGNCSSSLLLNFDNIFCGKEVNVTEQITMLIYCHTKTFNKACSWRQVWRLNFTGALIVFYFRQADLSGLCSVAFCLWTVSLSLFPPEGHFVVETRLAMIHVCTSNENAYQDRRVSYLRGIFDGLK